jgi:ABC-type oligopeptide transport system substrate-binding subunit
VYSTTALQQAIAEYIRQNWMDNLSVTVVLSGTNRNTFYNRLGTNPPQVWRLNWYYDHYDAYDFLYEGIFSVLGGRTMYGNWSNPTYDALLSQAAQTADPNTRKALYKQAEAILVETDAIMLPIYYSGNAIAAQPYLQRTYGDGGWGGRIAEWRIARQVFLPIILKN